MTQFEHIVGRELIRVILHRLVYFASLHSIQRCHIGVSNHLHTADNGNLILYLLH